MSQATRGIVFAQPLPERIVGTATLVVPVCGWLTGEAAASERVLVEIDGESAGELRLDEPVPPGLWPGRVDGIDSNFRGFAGELRLEGREAGYSHAVKLTVIAPRRDAWRVELYLVERTAPPRADIEERRQSPRIAICMAVYNPDPVAFGKQVRSITAQTRDDWVCIISDDGSDGDHCKAILDAIGQDSRFHFFRNAQNLGFYGNFEAALARVPETVEYVALADQDDNWYPDKLEALTEALVPGVLLAFSDMRIVAADGEVLSPSYWGYRLNNWTRLPLLLVANTVTGAACMMRRTLLDLLLPFPPRIGDAFHDHWIACAALSTGQVAYIDRPLYDYVQYDDSVIGHCGFDPPSNRRNDLRRGWLHYVHWTNLRSLVARFFGSGQAIYWHECRRIEGICRNLLARAAISGEKQRALSTYGHGLRSMMSLAFLNLATRDSARLTDNAERRLARGYLTHEVLSAARRLR